MRLELTVPKGLRGKTELLGALDAVEGSEDAKSLLRPILEIVSRAISTRIQQEVFDNFERYAQNRNLPRQDLGDVRIALDLPETGLEAARGDFIEIAMAGSEWIWQTASDGRAAAVFEVLCDILDEGLAPVDQQTLLDANLADLAG
ncbi:hypothetical protein SAMN04490244_1073 [Tranquillimonas rosea]|uniref:Uncharacterized protein n=1 Tax=Tranquillimonas rosea TaxID=641238 RepID=A0A1H9VCG2_9RHOB|nr:hypothetical protein [Tranquillimonas rosea]SES19278.1 hypothetical protein SAMN04490244_1073 [Tranquillimonas rosea]